MSRIWPFQRVSSVKYRWFDMSIEMVLAPDEAPMPQWRWYLTTWPVIFATIRLWVICGGGMKTIRAIRKAMDQS